MTQAWSAQSSPKVVSFITKKWFWIFCLKNIIKTYKSGRRTFDDILSNASRNAHFLFFSDKIYFSVKKRPRPSLRWQSVFAISSRLISDYGIIHGGRRSNDLLWNFQLLSFRRWNGTIRSHSRNLYARETQYCEGRAEVGGWWLTLSKQKKNSKILGLSVSQTWSKSGKYTFLVFI